MRRIKNREKLTKEDLSISLLKSDSSAAKQNVKKLFNNNNNNNNTVDDDNHDGKIQGKISDIRMILSRLVNIVNINDRKKIKRELYETEKKKNFSDKEKKENYNHLVELVRTLDKKYQYNDHDDLDCYGIRDTESLFGGVDGDDDYYYKPILVKSSFKNNCKYHESRGDKEKNLSVKQYLYKIIPYLSDIINDHKARKESNE